MQPAGDNGIKCRAVINEEHSYVCPLLVRVCQCYMEGCGDSIFCGPVCSVNVLVKVRWEGGLDVLQDQSLKALLLLHKQITQIT